jgi:hypothetical protein
MSEHAPFLIVSTEPLRPAFHIDAAVLPVETLQPKEVAPMKPVRSAESVRIRRELAQLMRRLRAIAKDQLTEDEVVARMNQALDKAGSVRRFVAISDGGDRSDRLCRRCLSRIDKRQLSEAGFAERPRRPGHEPQDAAAACL